MEVKVIVSLFVVYVYIFLKTKNNFETNEKQKWLSYDLLFILTPLLFFIPNDLVKMALYTVLSTICCFIYIYRTKNKLAKGNNLKISIMMLIYLIPVVLYLTLLNEKQFIWLYVIISILCYFNSGIITLWNKLEKKITYKK